MKVIKNLKKELKANRKAWVDMLYIFRKELYNIFTDSGAIIIFFVATLVYPLVVGLLYNNEMLRDAPIAIVDNDHSSMSRRYIRMIDATPEVQVVYECSSMAEAKDLQKHGKVHGIINIPRDFNSNINSGEQAHINIYADVTSFFWYRNLSMATSYVGRTLCYEIEAKGLIAKGATYDDAIKNVRKFIPQERLLYNPGGYPSFILPVILVLILQQTILMGTGILVGKTSERSKWKDLMPSNVHYRGLLRIIFGRALAIFIIYLPISIYVLKIIPYIFNIPQLAAGPWDILWFILPYILASIFMGMTISTFFYHRENALVVYIATSIPFLLLTGFPWPREAMPEFWKYVSYLLPSTFGAQGYVRMNTLGASLLDVSTEHFYLWIQTGFYFITTFLAYNWRVTKKARIKAIEHRHRKRRNRLERARKTDKLS